MALRASLFREQTKNAQRKFIIIIQLEPGPFCCLYYILQVIDWKISMGWNTDNLKAISFAGHKDVQQSSCNDFWPVTAIKREMYVRVDLGVKMLHNNKMYVRVRGRRLLRDWEKKLMQKNVFSKRVIEERKRKREETTRSFYRSDNPIAAARMLTCQQLKLVSSS